MQYKEMYITEFTDVNTPQHFEHDIIWKEYHIQYILLHTRRLYGCV